MHAAMCLYGADHLPSNRNRIVHHQLITRAEDGPSRRRQPCIATTISGCKSGVVKRRTIGLDHDPVLDDQIDPTDPWHGDLRAHAESEQTGHDPHDRFQPGLGFRIDEFQVTACPTREVLSHETQVAAPEQPQMQGAVDARNPRGDGKTLMSLEKSIDQRHSIRVSRFPVNQGTPVAPGARRISAQP